MKLYRTRGTRLGGTWHPAQCSSNWIVRGWGQVTVPTVPWDTLDQYTPFCTTPPPPPQQQHGRKSSWSHLLINNQLLTFNNLKYWISPLGASLELDRYWRFKKLAALHLADHLFPRSPDSEWWTAESATCHGYSLLQSTLIREPFSLNVIQKSNRTAYKKYL